MMLVIANVVLNLPKGEFARLATPWGFTSIQGHADGKGAVFCDYKFTDGDIAHYNNLIGEDLTSHLLRHHNTKGAQ